jgi:hypothetical protein
MEHMWAGWYLDSKAPSTLLEKFFCLKTLILNQQVGIHGWKEYW